MGTKLKFCTTCHPQKDGLSKRIIQTFVDMLRSCVMDFSSSWETHLLLVELAYNNNFQANIRMTPYEALLGSADHLYIRSRSEKVEF